MYIDKIKKIQKYLFFEITGAPFVAGFRVYRESIRTAYCHCLKTPEMAGCRITLFPESLGFLIRKMTIFRSKIFAVWLL